MAKRNMSENSLKNLENGKATQFKSGDKAAIESGRKGGLALGENNKERRLLKEICEIVGDLPDETTGDSNLVAMVKAQFEKAKKGDVSSFTALRDTMGQKPTDKQEITNTTPQIVVANETDLKALEELKNADINKGIS